MSIAPDQHDSTRSVLEQFLRDYLDRVGGVWDEVEPQVYDVLVPDAEVASGREPELLRLTFDPEALPEHPRAQLASLGTPVVDRLLQDAVQRGRGVELYLLGLNLQPANLTSRISRTLKAPDGWTMQLTDARPVEFPQLVFWFEATFSGDQREQDLVPVAIDLGQGREVRHFERLLDVDRLGARPAQFLPEGPCVTRAAAYALAREQVVRTVKSLANTRARELSEHIDRQAARMAKYYDDLAAELDDDATRASRREQDSSKIEARRATLARERDLRIAELRAKSKLAIGLRLLSLVIIRQPKLLLAVEFLGNNGSAFSLPVVWDPLVDHIEAPACPRCGRPTYALLESRGQLGCPSCPAADNATRHKPGNGRVKPR